MESRSSNYKIGLNPFVIGGAIFAVVVIILLVVSLIGLLRTNPYGNETRIDNISEEYKNLPQDQKDQIFSQLYDMLENNLAEGEEVPDSGAVVRDGTAEYDYDQITKIYHGEFVVDIPSVRQSYEVQFVWSPVENNEDLGGYSVVISCVPKTLRIYGETSCNNMIETNSFWDNAYQLDYTVGSRTSFEIRETIGGFLMSLIEGEDGYTISIDEATLKKDKTRTDPTFSFGIVLNQIYRFDVIITVDEEYGAEYIAIYIDGEDGTKGFIKTDSDESKDSLEAWLKMVSGDDDLMIDVSGLNESE